MDVFIKYMKFNMYTEFNAELENFQGINSECDIEGNYLIHYAALCKNSLFLKRLISANADISLLAADGSSFVHFIYHDIDPNILPNWQIDLRNKFGRTPLHGAIIRGNISMVEYLVSHVNMNTVLPENGYTYLHFAIYRKQSEIAKFLIEYSDLKTKDIFGNNIAMIRAKEKSDIFDTRFCYPGIYEEENAEHKNIFHILMECEDTTQWKLVYKKFPYLLSFIDINDRTVLHYAARFMNVQQFDELVGSVHPTLYSLKDLGGWNIATEAAVHANCCLLDYISKLGVEVSKLEELESLRGYNPGIVKIALSV